MQDIISVVRLVLDAVVFITGLYLFIEKLFPAIREYRIVQFIDRTILAAKRVMKYASDSKLLESELALIEQWLQQNGYDMNTDPVGRIFTLLRMTMRRPTYEKSGTADIRPAQSIRSSCQRRRKQSCCLILSA